MATASKGRVGPAKPGAARGLQRTLSPLRVRYMRRMKRQRVYQVEVSWAQPSRLAASASNSPVVVRLIMAGAQVVPAERAMDPNRPQERALFYVTPLARGWLRGERLEVLMDGRKVQEIPLPSKVISQRASWALLISTFLLPWLWSVLIKQHEFIHHPSARPGGQLRSFIQDNFPQVPDLLTDKAPDVAGFFDSIPLYLEAGLNLLHHWSFMYPLVFWLACGLLVLTALSLLVHRDKRKTKVGDPIPVPDRDEGSPQVF